MANEPSTARSIGSSKRILSGFDVSNQENFGQFLVTQSGIEQTLEVSNPEQTEVSHFIKINKLPDLPFINILRKFETHEKLLTRSVCYRWKVELERLLKKTKYLKLNLAASTEKQHYHEWRTAQSINSIQFDNHWTGPALDRMTKLTIREGHFKMSLIDTFAHLFSNVQVLVIYFDLMSSQHNVNVLAKLIQVTTNLTSLSIIRSVYDKNTEPSKPVYMLRDICIGITGMKCKLNRLDLNIYSEGNFFEAGMLVGQRTFPIRNFINVFKSIEHFSILLWPTDLFAIFLKQIYEKLGKGEQQQQASNIKSLGLERRSFKRNLVLSRSADYASVQHLQLNEITSNNKVEELLGTFPQIQSLGLYYEEKFHDAEFQFNQLEWINKKSKLTKLTFWSTFGLYEDGPTAQNILHLTLCLEDLFNCLFGDNSQNIFMENFVQIIVYKFPSLVQLTLNNVRRAGKEQTPSEELRNNIRRMLREQLPTLSTFTILDSVVESRE